MMASELVSKLFVNFLTNMAPECVLKKTRGRRKKNHPLTTLQRRWVVIVMAPECV